MKHQVSTQGTDASLFTVSLLTGVVVAGYTSIKYLFSLFKKPEPTPVYMNESETDQACKNNYILATLKNNTGSMIKTMTAVKETFEVKLTSETPPYFSDLPHTIETLIQIADEFLDSFSEGLKSDEERIADAVFTNLDVAFILSYLNEQLLETLNLLSAQAQYREMSAILSDQAVILRRASSENEVGYKHWEEHSLINQAANTWKSDLALAQRLRLDLDISLFGKQKKPKYVMPAFDGKTENLMDLVSVAPNQHLS